MFHPFSSNTFRSLSNARSGVCSRSIDPAAKKSFTNCAQSTPAIPLNHSKISRSVFVVVGDVKCSVSEMIPAHKQIDVPLSGAAPPIRYMIPTIVDVLPTGSFKNRIGSFVRKFPLKRW